MDYMTSLASLGDLHGPSWMLRLPVSFLESVGRTLACFFLAAAGYVLFIRAVRRPIPGIPYNWAARYNPLGDLTTMLRSPRDRRDWVLGEPAKHGSTISQIFLGFWRPPVVVVTDYREVVDICSRRLHEFDKPEQGREILAYTAPSFHIMIPSGDPALKHHKGLLRDLMQPRYLHEMNGSVVHDKTQLLLKLWGLKSKLGQGRPFEAGQDLNHVTLDMMCAVALDMEHGKSIIHSHVRELEKLETSDVSSEPKAADVDTPVKFLPPPIDAENRALLNIADMISIAQRFPLPKLTQRIALLDPRNARARRCRDDLIRRQIDRCIPRLTECGPRSRRSALDHMVWDELRAAYRDTKWPDLHSPAIRDETLGYIVGGHETLATAMSWWVKHMTTHQDVQGRLRAELRRAHTLVDREERPPSIKEIMSANMPYLDAVIEETLRMASVVPTGIREAVCNMQLLGHDIPKGTPILTAWTGSSVNAPAMAVAESRRTEACRDAKGTTPLWGDDVAEYRPERWLRRRQDAGEAAGDEDKDESHEYTKFDDDEVIFDANAGPTLAFGTGRRECFGKRLAHVVLRTMVTMLLWEWHIAPLDDRLNGSDTKEAMTMQPRDCFVKLRKTWRVGDSKRTI